MLGESKRGAHSQATPPSGAISAPVWQSERKAKSSMGGKGDGIAALWPSPLPVFVTSLIWRGTYSGRGRRPSPAWDEARRAPCSLPLLTSQDISRRWARPCVHKGQSRGRVERQL